MIIIIVIIVIVIVIINFICVAKEIFLNYILLHYI